MNLYYRIFANPFFYPFHRYLLNFALRGLGFGHYHSLNASGESHFLKKIFPKKERPLIFDIGAFKGDYSQEVLIHHPKAQLFAFEPHSQSFRKLQQVAEKHHFQAYNFGFGKEKRRAKLYDHAGEGSTGHASLLRESFLELYGSQPQSQEITLRTIDGFCQEHDITQIDLLKIDAEGSEYEILQGAERMIASLSIDVIQFELTNIMSLTKVFIEEYRALLPHYDFFRLLPRGWVPLEKKYALINQICEYQTIVARRRE